MKAIAAGVLASFFFAFTFIFNRAMDLQGGSWIWSASLRYFFMVPLLLIIVMYRGNLKQLFQYMKTNPKEWLLWSIIGFGLFYAPLSFAGSFGPGWLVASTWQITIIAGILLTPLFANDSLHKKIPVKELMMSGVILMGVVLMQVEHASSLGIRETVLCVLPVIVAAFAYPLGNRKMMQVCKGELDVFQRVLGMTLASLPFWFLLSGYGAVTAGLPSSDQVFQCFIVAISSGLIATVLFFFATDLVKDDPQKLATVEATQSGEVLFALLGELILLSAPLPSSLSWVGMSLVVVGMILHSYVAVFVKKEEKIPA
ncbi:multidrug resistance efflux transporter family protein [Bacillus sp. DX1.1]|uniref:DMT family transporter n=1 Tax=unclassified Bacillus (in: firmicutes) TaxID=185979 RepID=UPI002571275F|nr:MULTISPECIES: multidrug resistance efflux transporter family protein [unclassified Bacillus (in: firmicutes)]MDM5155278.1 multidrug resistance efflux transporter family protein [Bacillus sp. DX1.1]WJE79598.1 multidrug resistance efflux transporter family protein [Bacillus sp. DX3.1]